MQLNNNKTFQLQSSFILLFNKLFPLFLLSFKDFEGIMLIKQEK